MKKLLVLPGNSIHNRQWGEACAGFFNDSFAEVYLQTYNHWESGEPKLNFSIEMEKVVETVELGGDNVEWYIFAKSIGSVLALMAIQADLIEPKKCVFFGMPLDLAVQNIFAGDMTPLTEFVVPALVFHNDADPTADCFFTEKILQEFGQNIIFKKIAGDNHDYLDFKNYKFETEEFLS